VIQKAFIVCTNTCVIGDNERALGVFGCRQVAAVHRGETRNCQERIWRAAAQWSSGWFASVCSVGLDK